jgi:hypothetical protein
LLVAIALPASTFAAEPQTRSVKTAFDAAAAKDAVQKYASLLEEMYVYPEIGTAYAALLRKNLASGRYSDFASAEQFADALPRDLAAVNPDLHLSVLPASVPAVGVFSKTAYLGGTCPAAGKQLTSSIGKAGWLAPGVAYIEFCGFQGGATNLGQLKEFLEKHASAKTLIIDNRGNIGGAQEEMDLMFPHFFRSLVELLRFEMRAAVAEEDSNPLKADPRMKRLPAGATTQFAYIVEPDPRLKTPILDAKLYVLTSKATASAGEAATFALQQSRRAEIIGEVTQGAGHLGPTMPIGGGYRAFIPIARIFDADTGKGWEGKGVVPDVPVPAAQALDVAAARAGIDGIVAKEAWRRLPSRQPPR